MSEPVNCPKCDIPPKVDRDFEWTAVCTNCYDADCVGDPPRFVSSSIHAMGRTRDDVIEEWNEQVADYLEDRA